MKMTLTAADIIALMEAASKYGVTKFSYGAVRFTTVEHKTPAPLRTAQQEALERIAEEDRAAVEWATAEPPLPNPESM